MSTVTRAIPTPLSPSHLPLLGVALACAAAAGCSEEEEPSEAFVVRSTAHAAASTAEPLLCEGNWLAYRLGEFQQDSTDFNGDGDVNDAIAVRHNTATRISEVLNVATLELAFVNETLFLLVDEAGDDKDWNGDTDKTDRVLLFQVPGSPDPVFYDEVPLGLSEGLIRAEGRLLYPSTSAPSASMESNWFMASVPTAGAAPDPKVRILCDDSPTGDGITFSVTSEDKGFVFLLANENVEGVDLNGDSDSDDSNILFVVDGNALTPHIFETQLAFAPQSIPSAIAIEPSGNWLVSFLVEEEAQAVNLNDPNALLNGSWQPAACIGLDDTDLDDFVLHWFQLNDLIAGTSPVNTGLVGREDGAAYSMLDLFVGTTSPEADEGTGGGCDLNADGDKQDIIFRWVQAADPAAIAVAPETDPNKLHAVAFSLPGGTGGVLAMRDKWVIVVDESADGEIALPGNQDLVGALVPSQALASWNFIHGSGAPTPAELTWMTPDPQDPDRFFASISESSFSLGLGPSFDGNDDGDFDDDIPAIASTAPQAGAPNELYFPGVPVAVARGGQPGLFATGSLGVQRVSEADQGNMDINGDGDANDNILQRFSIATGNTAYMATSNSAPTPASYFEGSAPRFGAFLISESMASGDLNGDGDFVDLVIRYYRLQ